MRIELPIDEATGYKSPTQIARVVTEKWLLDNMYCPACVSLHVDATPPGTKVYDFQCDDCTEKYQLKSKSTPFGKKLPDSAYEPLREAIEEDRAPSFFFMQYSRQAWVVCNLYAVPSHFITLAAVEKRRPLSSTARRHGWQGCNILLDRLPVDAWIPIVVDGRIREIREVRDDWRRFSFLKKSTLRSRGWTSDILTCVRRLGKNEFTLQEVYAFEEELSKLHPENRHIRPKIRQQLQVLRDKGFLLFLGRGRYKIRF